MKLVVHNRFGYNKKAPFIILLAVFEAKLYLDILAYEIREYSFKH